MGLNVLANTDLFQTEIFMYVYEEVIDTQKLTDIINTQHENTKYLPDIKIPPNVVCMLHLQLCV